MNVANHNDGLAGTPSNVEQPSCSGTLSAQGQPGPGASTPSHGGEPVPRTPLPVLSYSVEGLDPKKRPFLPGRVVRQITECGAFGPSGFAGANKYEMFNTRGGLIVQNQKQLDFLNRQIENKYIDEEKLVHLELLFIPKNIQSLPKSITSLNLNFKVNVIELRKIFDHLTKLEVIEFGFEFEKFDQTHLTILPRGDLKKICFNNRIESNEETTNAFEKMIANNENLHTLQIRSPFTLRSRSSPFTRFWDGAKAVAISNIHTLDLSEINSLMPLDEYKIFLESKTLNNFTFKLDGARIKDLRTEIENCTINNLQVIDTRFRNNGNHEYFVGAGRVFGEKKINISLQGIDELEELNWILKPELFQDVGIDFCPTSKICLNQEFFDLIAAHPGRMRLYLNNYAESYGKDWSVELAKCLTLHMLGVSSGWARSDLEKFEGHPSLATLIIGPSGKCDYDGLELLAKIPSLSSLHLNSLGLTGKVLRSLENIRTLKKIGLTSDAPFTEDIAGSIAALPQLRTVDLRQARVLRKNKLALNSLLAAKHITEIHLPEYIKSLFDSIELIELLRESPAGRIQFWSPDDNNYHRVSGPELPPTVTPGAQLLV